MEGDIKVALARHASYFPLLVQRKVTKANDTPLPRHPSVLAPQMGGCGTRAFSTQTVLAAYPSAAQASGAAQGIESQNPLFSTVIPCLTRNPVSLGWVENAAGYRLSPV
jgi:hypothetical protein